MARSRRLIFPFFSLLFIPLVLAGAASSLAQGPGDDAERLLWGVWEGEEGDTFGTTHPVATFCVAAEGPVHLAFAGAEEGGHPGYFFEPTPESPDCVTGLGGSKMVVAQADSPLRVMVSQLPPRVLDQPGVTPLGEAGSLRVVRALSQGGEVTIAPGDAALQLAAYSWPGMQSLAVESKGAEWRVVPDGSGAVAVLVLEESGGQSLLRWAEPVWYPVAPTVGEALVPVALALLVSLFRGGAGGAAVRPAPGKRAQATTV